MENVIIRRAEFNECPELAKIKGEVWNTTYRGIYADEALDNYDIAKNTRIFEQIRNNPGIELVLAEVDGKIVEGIDANRLVLDHPLTVQQ